MSLIDDLQSEIDDIKSSNQDYQDEMEGTIDDLNSSINDQGSAIDDLNENSGQLTFPLSQDTIDLITEQGPAVLQYLYTQGIIGVAVLVAGTVTVFQNTVSSASLIMLSRTVLGGTPGNLSYTATTGQFTISSSSATETSTVLYLILTS